MIIPCIYHWSVCADDGFDYSVRAKTGYNLLTCFAASKWRGYSVLPRKPGRLPGRTPAFALWFCCFAPKARAFARAYPGICPGILPFQSKNQGVYQGVPRHLPWDFAVSVQKPGRLPGRTRIYALEFIWFAPRLYNYVYIVMIHFMSHVFGQIAKLKNI